MNQEMLDGEEQFEVVVENVSLNPDDLFFNDVLQALQQIILNSNFQKNQAGFMRKNCHIFQQGQQNQKQQQAIFEDYKKLMNKCLNQMLSQKIKDFDMSRFKAMLSNKANQIDEQIYEILMSLQDYEVFKTLMSDYRVSYQEQQRLRVLTIKSTKVPEHKKVKGANQNIFGSANVPTFDNQLLSKKKNKKIEKQKTQEQILVPDLVLTIRPLRKG